MKNKPNLERLTKAQLLEVLNNQFDKESELWKEVSEWTSKSNRLETQVLELNCSVQSRDHTIKDLREAKTKLELENMQLTADIADATRSVKTLRSERSEYAKTAADLHEYIETIREEQKRDEAVSAKVHTNQILEIKKWKVLLAKEILENADD